MMQGGEAVSGLVWALLARDFWVYLIFDVLLSALALLAWLGLYYVVLKRLKVCPATLQLKWPVKAVQGLVLGVAAVLLVVLPIWLLRGYSAGAGWETFTLINQEPNVWLTWKFFAAQSLFEELLFRAVGMMLLAVLLFWLIGFVRHPQRKSGDWLEPSAQRFVKLSWLASGLCANLVVSGAFAFVHTNNPGATLLSTLNVGLAGMVLGQLFWLHGTVHGAWIWHWVWNALIASLGLPVSGYALAPAVGGIGFNGARAGMFTGGSFGPEGSIVCSVVLSAMFALLLWYALRGIRQSEAQTTTTELDGCVPPASEQAAPIKSADEQV